jgi:hypothetical protein
MQKQQTAKKAEKKRGRPASRFSLMITDPNGKISRQSCATIDEAWSWLTFLTVLGCSVELRDKEYDIEVSE